MAPLIPRPGDITTSGDLFEGNFEEWHLRIMASLRSRDLEGHVGDNAEYFRKTFPAKWKKAANHIREKTYHTMLSRVPKAHLNDAKKLFESLKQLATPFRFFDLPAEIRNRIYDLTLGDFCMVYDNSVGAENELVEDEEWKPWSSKYPPLLHASSQIRREASSVFYATTDFLIALPSDGTHTDLDRAALETWSKDIVAGQLKHLRQVRLTVNAEAQLYIRFSAKRGLTCTFDWNSGDISEEGEDMLEEHTQAIESARKALGLSGEAIVMAILSGWGMWRKLREEIVDAAEMDSDDGWD